MVKKIDDAVSGKVITVLAKSDCRLPKRSPHRQQKLKIGRGYTMIIHVETTRKRAYYGYTQDTNHSINVLQTLIVYFRCNHSWCEAWTQLLQHWHQSSIEHTMRIEALIDLAGCCSGWLTSAKWHTTSKRCSATFVCFTVFIFYLFLV